MAKLVAPIVGSKIDLYQGSTFIKTDYTDADGFYSFIEGWENVQLSGGVKYTVKWTLPDGTVLGQQDVIAQSLKAVVVNFTQKE